MVVNRNRKSLLGFFLADDILVEKSLDLLRLHQIDLGFAQVKLLIGQLVLQNLRAYIDTLVTDIYSARSGNQFADLVLRLVAEGAADLIKVFICHSVVLISA
jgi:hypothetical protein